MLPRNNSKRICVDSIDYRYVVSDSNAADGTVSLTVNVQSEDGNGAVLRVIGLTTSRVPEDESKFYMGRTVSKSILPRHVAKLIALATASGWNPQQAGAPVVLQLTNEDVFDVS